ncbi:MAG TPA: hypothetical protein PLL71_15370, partial [Agriterribacter sp.]|nr:hypothetical protein [Agriterribacter sp.]
MQDDNPAEAPTLDKQGSVPSGDIRTLPGFKAELLYEVPRRSQGTWVTLAIDEQGNMVASDEYQQGMYQIDIQKNDEGKTKVQVSKMVLPATGAQGLTWFKKSLYANVNGSGLFRMSASKKDGMLDEMKFLGGPQN